VWYAGVISRVVDLRLVDHEDEGRAAFNLNPIVKPPDVVRRRETGIQGNATQLKGG
jgi:hypothetical protein